MKEKQETGGGVNTLENKIYETPIVKQFRFWNYDLACMVWSVNEFEVHWTKKVTPDFGTHIKLKLEGQRLNINHSFRGHANTVMNIRVLKKTEVYSPVDWH
jgi:hypothetical protein